MRARPATIPTLCGLLLTATLASAQPQPQKQPPPPPAKPQDPAPVPAPPSTSLKAEPKLKEPAPSGRIARSDVATLSGCLQRAEEPAGAAGAAGQPGRLAAGYILRQATATTAKEAPGGARGERGARGTKEYRIVAGRDSIKLAEHVGHQVEVAGRLSLQDSVPNPAGTEAGTSASQPSGSTGVSATPSTGTGAAPLVTLTITSLKMIASSCTTPTN